jgi:hypothetical protein
MYKYICIYFSTKKKTMKQITHKILVFTMYSIKHSVQNVMGSLISLFHRNN